MLWHRQARVRPYAAACAPDRGSLLRNAQKKSAPIAGRSSTVTLRRLDDRAPRLGLADKDRLQSRASRRCFFYKSCCRRGIIKRGSSAHEKQQQKECCCGRQNGNL